MPVTDVTNSFITTDAVKERETGSLNGMTFGVKDSIPVKGLRCTHGSRVMFDHIAESNSRIVQTILFNGGEIAGKTNMHEFGMGATGTSSVMGPCRNPFDMGRICGGSSSGSAAAVASGHIDVGIGTDTGGSIRIPAALCGVIGYKPSNMYSRSDSEIPFSSLLEATGIITKDFTTLKWVTRELFPTIEEMDWNSERMRIGIIGDTTDRNFSTFLANLKNGKKGITVESASLPLLEDKGTSVRKIISSKDGYEAHKSLIKKHPYDYFPDVRKVLESGSKIEKSDYDDALSLRKDMISQYNEALSDFDVIISPTTPNTAPRISDVIGNEEEYRENLVGKAELLNVVGAPSLSIPSGFVEGLPTGLMISGGPGDDSKTLQIAEALNIIIWGKPGK